MPAQKPTVSVVIPTCNRLDLLPRSIESALRQTRAPLEIIVVNDAGAPIDSLVASLNKDGLLKAITHETNKGAAATRNTGIRAARGDYIAFLDDDDTWLPEHLEKVVGAMEKAGAQFGYGQAEYILDNLVDGQLVNLSRTQPYSDIPYSRKRLMVGNFIPTPTWVFRRELAEKVGYMDEALSMCEDWEWLLRASAEGDFLRVPEVTVEVRQRLHDSNHLILQHRAKMNSWIEKVYGLHPVDTEEMRLARYEHTHFGTAKDLEAEQQAVVDQAFKAAAAGTLDLVGLFNAAEIMDGANQRHHSIALYRSWLANSQGPMRHAACFNLGVGLQNLGDLDGAEQAYRQSVGLEAKFSLARLQLANLLEQKGSVDEALEHWRIVVRQERASGSLSHTQASNNLKRYLEV